jgi:hypothetical protein
MLNSIRLALKDLRKAKYFIVISALLCGLITAIFTSATESSLRFPSSKIEGTGFRAYVVSTETDKTASFIQTLEPVYNDERIVSVFRSMRLSRALGRPAYLVLGNAQLLNREMNAGEETRAYAYSPTKNLPQTLIINAQAYPLQGLNQPFGKWLTQSEAAENPIVLTKGALPLSDWVVDEAEVFSLLGGTRILSSDPVLINRFLDLANTGIYAVREMKISALERNFVFGYLYPLLFASLLSAFLSFVTISRAWLLSLTRELAIHTLCGSRKMYLYVRFGVLIAFIPLFAFLFVYLLLGTLVTDSMHFFILINLAILLVLFSYIVLSLRRTQLSQHLLEDQ